MKTFLDEFELEAAVDAITDEIQELQYEAILSLADRVIDGDLPAYRKARNEWAVGRIEFLKTVKEKLIAMNMWVKNETF